MCEYTDHGHCGILHGHEVDNDETLAHLAKIAVSHAAAGADMGGGRRCLYHGILPGHRIGAQGQIKGIRALTDHIQIQMTIQNR